jgi:hypothetical protein
MDPHLPKFISDYPTGRVDVVGRNLRHMGRDASGYLPPLRSIDNAGVAAIVMPVSRRIADIRNLMVGNMRLAEEFGMYLVVLCSHGCSRQDIARLAKDFPRLQWAAIDGPFQNSSLADLVTSDILFTFPKDNDLAAKRNFGLQLGRNMGWDAVLFADDDRILTRNYLLKLLSLRRNGAALVMSSSRTYPDNSVVVGAYRQAYGDEHIDSFMDSSTSVIGLKDNWLSFYPQIYNEDWLFMLPHILQRHEVAWAGSVKQRRYNPFIKNRAKREEAGDLIAEGLMRLAITLVNETSIDSRQDLLEELVKRTDADFWEREILQRAIFIREMLNKTSRYKPSLRKQRIKSALQVSLRTLIGDENQDGLDPTQIARWVQAWRDDLNTWRNTPALQLQDAKRRIGNVLQLMGAADRATWHDAARSPQLSDQVSAIANVKTESLLPNVLGANPQQAAGLQSTWYLMNYLSKTRQSINDLAGASSKLRYDRPIRSITGNKPVATVAIIVRMYEDPDSVSQSIKNITSWNTQQTPIHCVIWIAPDTKRRSQFKLYREYLMARLMLETIGTNIRLLSCIGDNRVDSGFQKIMSELVGTMAKLYWKTAIDSVNHPVFIVNSQNEIQSQGILSDLLQNRYQTPPSNLRHELAALTPVQNSAAIDTPEHRRAAELAKNRLLRQSMPLETFRQPQFSTWRLMWAMKTAGISLFELDKIHYLTQVHHSLEFDAFAAMSRVTGVLLSTGTGMDKARSAIEHAVTKAGTTNVSSDELVGVVVVISDDQSLDELEKYRARVVSEILPDITVSDTVFIASSIIPKLKKGNTVQLGTYEALIRYEHWLENHKTRLKMKWTIPSLNNRPTITRRLRLTHAAMALVVGSRASDYLLGLQK